MAEFQKFLISRAKAGQSYADVIRALSDEDMATLLRILHDNYSCGGSDPSLAWCTDEAAASAHCLTDEGDLRPEVTDDTCALCTLRFIKQVPVV
jgi:hypothetical protein